MGVLLDNTPDMLTAMAAAGLGGYVLCGINNTRRGDALARDIGRADCQILVTDDHHLALLDGVDLTGVRVLVVGSPEWKELVGQAGALTPHREAGATDTFMLIFTSGTSGDPKAVRVMHAMVLLAGAALAGRYGVDSRRRLLPVDAVVPQQCGARGVVGGAELGRRDGARDVHGLRFHRRHPALRRHLHELRR